MSITIYHNPRCSKSRSALQILEESDTKHEIIEYLKNPLSADELRNVIDKLGIEPEDLVRKNEAIYKEKFKGKSLNAEQWIQAMVDYPKLMERPIIIKEDKAIVARPPEKVKEIL